MADKPVCGAAWLMFMAFPFRLPEKLISLYSGLRFQYYCRFNSKNKEKKMATVTLNIGGMTCGGCVKSVAKVFS
ncbi:heavy-metal-associated domain-containing protein, partial [Kingella kingae]|uniref:heavy-metal-associated domain-containing protein n=1 Tax=Kingella kingae TaxID=504 RepID=UPI0022A7C0AB